MSKDPKSDYYDEGGIEVLNVMKAKVTAEQYKGFLLCSIIKYSLRLNFKGTPDRDAEKCAVYADELAGLSHEVEPSVDQTMSAYAHKAKPQKTTNPYGVIWVDRAKDEIIRLEREAVEIENYLETHDDDGLGAHLALKYQYIESLKKQLPPYVL